MVDEKKKGRLLEDILSAEGGIDRTTGLLSKNALEQGVEQSFSERILELRGKGPKDTDYSVILFDVDYFKAINDLFSHQQGDSILGEIGDILSRYAAEHELIGVLGRYGGEEFLIALPYSGSRSVRYIADEIRALVEGFCFKDFDDEGKPLGEKITISLGVHTEDVGSVVACVERERPEARKGIIEEKLKALLNGADTALAYAKFMGRNRVEVVRNFLLDEMTNIGQVRRFYVLHSYKRPAALKGMLSDDYFRQNHRIKGKIDKHFAFIRTELSPRDTRTMATLADNTYKLASGDYGTGKEDFLAFIRKYS